jgi:hypothetical protein
LADNIKGEQMKRKYIKQFRIETNSGKIVGHSDNIESAEWIADKGRNRWVYRWIEKRYIAWRQYNTD